MKYYRLIWNLASFLPHGKVIHLDLEINNTCNQSCIMCWHNGVPLFKKQVMKTNVAMKALKKYRDAGCMSVKLNLRGEPLMHPRLRDLVKFANQLGYVDIMINTNGVLLTKEMMKDLDDAGLTTCIISLDSFDVANYCQIHDCKMSEYETLLANIAGIANIKNLQCKVKLNYHVNKINKGEQRPAEYAGFPVVYRTTMPRESKNISTFIVNKANEVIKATRLRKRKCPHMMRRVAVLVNGKEYPCCVCYKEPEDIRLKHDGTRNYLIRNYKKNILEESCVECTSQDIYK